MIFISATVNIIHVIKFMWIKKITHSVKERTIFLKKEKHKTVFISSICPTASDLPAQNLQFTADYFLYL